MKPPSSGPTAAAIAAGESRLRHLAMHDPLCGLPNRIFFGERLEAVIEEVRNGSAPAAVFYIDLDHFKDVNDTLGHHVGDELIRNVTLRLSHTLRGGDLVVKGRVGARSGIDQKGGTILTLGSAGSMTGFMMQRGRQIICEDAGPGLGDSMYDGIIYVGGKVKALGIDCVPGEWTDADTEYIERKFRIYGLGTPPSFDKFVCGKKLYNYDNLEPSERKLVL